MTGQTITRESLVERAPGVAEVEHPAGLVVLLLDSPSCNPHELSGSGVDIWQRLAAGPQVVGPLVIAVAAHALLEPSAIEKSVLEFLTALAEAGLVRPVPADTSL